MSRHPCCDEIWIDTNGAIKANLSVNLCDAFNLQKSLFHIFNWKAPCLFGSMENSNEALCWLLWWEQMPRYKSFKFSDFDLGNVRRNLIISILTFSELLKHLLDNSGNLLTTRRFQRLLLSTLWLLLRKKLLEARKMVVWL